MGGVINSLLMSSSDNHLVTVGTNGTNHGFADTPFGSIDRATIFGITVLNIVDVNNVTFLIQVNTVVSQDLFRSVGLQKNDGSFVFLTSASATFSSPSGKSQWTWTPGDIWGTSDVGNNRLVVFYK
jgi:hypothetical protein